MRLLVWLVIGFVIYGTYGRHHSRLRQRLGLGVVSPGAPEASRVERPLARTLAIIFRTKTHRRDHAQASEASAAHGSGLEARARHLWISCSSAVGAIIGAGILSALGTGLAGGFDSNVGYTRPGAGPALIVSFALTAVACGFTALCYAELASMIPVSGSAYTYAYATLGELMAWIIGWDLLLEYAVSNVAVAISWGSYATGLLAAMGIHMPSLAGDRSAHPPADSPRPTRPRHPGISVGDKLAELAHARAGEIDGERHLRSLGHARHRRPSPSAFPSP